MTCLRYGAGAMESACPYKRKAEGSTQGARKIFFFPSFFFFYISLFFKIVFQHSIFFSISSGTSPFFPSRNRHSRSQLPTRRLSLLQRRSSYVEIDTNVEMPGWGLTRKMTKPEKRKKNMNPMKPDQIRSTMASVRTEPRRVAKDVTSVSR